MLDHMEQISLFDGQSGLLSLQKVDFFRLIQLLVKRWLQNVGLLQADHLSRRQLDDLFVSLLGSWGVLVLLVGA